MQRTITAACAQNAGRFLPNRKFATTTAALSQQHREVSRATADFPRILITGALGQLGRSLEDLWRRQCLYERYFEAVAGEPYFYLDILNPSMIDAKIVDNQIDWIVHFSTILSALGESQVPLALRINCEGVQNILQVGRQHKLRVFIPSTIGAFGPTTPRQRTPDLTIQRPRTIYGVSKVHAELLGEYYAEKFGVDFRSLRFPGIISATKPGGGTTDYAVQIFYDALEKGVHTCYLRPDTCLPMMYEADCLKSVVNFLETAACNLTHRTYNVAAMSFTPEQIAAAIRRVLPEFRIEYKICPIRQAIADSWPESLDDSCARRDWAWKPQYELDETVDIMFRLLNEQSNRTAGSASQQGLAMALGQN